MGNVVNFLKVFYHYTQVVVSSRHVCEQPIKGYVKSGDMQCCDNGNLDVVYCCKYCKSGNIRVTFISRNFVFQIITLVIS